MLYYLIRFLLFICVAFHGNGFSAGTEETNDAYAYHIGHSTVFLYLDGVHILIDPNFNEMVYFRKRDNPPALAIEDLPAVDLILISHGHWDHMDMGSLERVTERFPEAKIHLPLRLGTYLEWEGMRNYQELSNDQKFSSGPLTVSTYRMNHSGDRYLFDNTSLTLGYVIRGSRTVFFAGDSGYDDVFKRIGREHDIDLAFVESHGWRRAADRTNAPGAPRRACGYSGCVSLFRMIYGRDNLPRSVPRHLQAEETIQVLKDLRAKKMVPIHYDTFNRRISAELDFSDPLALLREAARGSGVEDRIIFNGRGRKIPIR